VDAAVNAHVTDIEFGVKLMHRNALPATRTSKSPEQSLLTKYTGNPKDDNSEEAQACCPHHAATRTIQIQTQAEHPEKWRGEKTHEKAMSPSLPRRHHVLPCPLFRIHFWHRQSTHRTENYLCLQYDRFR
jgi:hypothetical protein